MTDETIVAAFDTAAEADAAARDVEAAGIPASCITKHAGTDTGTLITGSGATSTHKEPGFWAKLFGDTDDHYTSSLHDDTVYSHTMAGGGSVLSISIKNVEQDGDRVLDILEAHHPIDIEERASSYAASTGATTGGYTAAATTAAPTTGDNQTIQLAEEALVVGKRVVNRGTTRIRRYVVETPVSEDVALRNESVSIERRAATGTGTVPADAFTDKTIEVTELNEEAVVGKTARVVEEVVVRKDVNDRVETVHDTVRKEELEVEKIDQTGTTGSTTTTPYKAA